MINISQKANSKISFSLPLDTSSVLYRQQPVSLYSEDFGVGEFLLGKVSIRNNEIRWNCPREQLSGCLKIKSLYRKMKEGTGLKVVEEAVELLETITGIKLETDNLIYLDTGHKSIFILFQNWDTMDSWTSGISYIDLLSILNDLDCEPMTPCDMDTDEKAWVFDMCYKRTAEDEFEAKITFFNKGNQYITVKSIIMLHPSSIEEHTFEIVNSIGKNVDAVGNQIIELYIVNCIREIVAEGLVKDILSPYSQKMVFKPENAVELFNHCAQWYGAIEKKHKADQISQQLDALAACRVRDPLLICLRLMELQKFTLQNHLRKLSVHFLGKEDTEANPIKDRLTEIVKLRDEAIQRANFHVPRSAKDCSCDCVII